VAPQGCKASAGEDQKPRLYRFINRQTRIMERFSTVGRDEYVLKPVTSNVYDLREEVLTPIEPLTSGRDHIASQIKRPNYSSMSLLEA